MSLVVTTNISAMNTSRNLSASNNNLSKSIEKLSSGYRINTGADGPADLVISEQLRAQVSGLNRAVRNTSEAINVLSIAEGALNEMNSILKNMKALAVHAANNGITSPEQIESDQAELDSGIATLNRIANSTKYSDQFLLNGSKDLTYDVSTEIKGTQNNTLVDAGSSVFTQIYKRDGFAVTVGFSGTRNADNITNIGDASMTNQAAKAYLEIDTAPGSISQVDENGNLTQSQSFILTGSLGSKQFTFGAGTNISQVVTAISNYSGSTGIDASLTFNSTQTINQTTNAANASVAAMNTQTTIGTTSARGVDDLVVFDNYTTDAAGDSKLLVNDISGNATGVHYGYNTDGQGRIYIKITGANTYELYKDESLSAASLIGSGASGSAMVEQNNSGLSGLVITLSGDGQYGDVAYISTGNILLDETNVSYSGIMVDETGTTASATANNSFAMSNSIASGVQLGVNTSSDGKIYTKVVTDENGLSTVYAYKDSAMRDEDLVAKSQDDIDLANAEAVILNAIWNDEGTASTGLALHLNLNSSAATNFSEAGTYDGSITFSNLGARVYTTEYGSDALLQVQQLSGGIFTYYDQAGKASSATLIDAGGTGTTYSAYGQDATVNVNGQQMKTTGLTLDLSTSDVTAKIVFNEGKTGSTTIAQVGYGEGSIFTKNQSLTYTEWSDADGDGYSAMLNNANHNTNEIINHFQGGMQLQLGEGSGDQERTVIAIKSMAIENLGRIKYTAQFDPDNAVIETRTLSLSDVQGGQIASLQNNAVLAMSIIEQAISDVSNLRAQIGAVQANMLQTNQNNLEVAIENITKTESNIRDTDMASEMTEYTTQQVLANAGISMLTQANSQAQNVLSLLR